MSNDPPVLIWLLVLNQHKVCFLTSHANNWMSCVALRLFLIKNNYTSVPRGDCLGDRYADHPITEAHPIG